MQDLEIQLRNWDETTWHREWKLAFPAHYRERSFLNKALGYHHRADVFTNCGTAIEFQHSPISLAELAQREAFYLQLVWVLNAKMFKGFKLLKHLPEMNDNTLADYELAQGSNLALMRKADIFAGLPKPKKLTLSHPELRHLKPQAKYLSFAWRHPHKVWYAAQAPLWIDLGGHFLYQMLHRPQLSGNYTYLKVVTKKEFVLGFL